VSLTLSPPKTIMRAPVAVASEHLSASQYGTVITTSDGIRLGVDLIADGLREPTDLAFTPDGRFFVAERSGRVRVIEQGGIQPEPALTLTDVTITGGGGLLSLALDPRFERTHFLYALYTTSSRSGHSVFRIARFRETMNTLADRAIVLDEIAPSSSRASASLRFGPDGMLYAAIDDGGDPQRGDDIASFNGKILRLNADGSTPDDQAGLTPVYSCTPISHPGDSIGSLAQESSGSPIAISKVRLGSKASAEMAAVLDTPWFEPRTRCHV